MKEYTKKIKRAVRRIINDGRMRYAMLAGEIDCEDGVIVTDGFVLLHAPKTFGLQKCLFGRISEKSIGADLHKIFVTAYQSNVFTKLSTPFGIHRNASLIVDLCEKYGFQGSGESRYIRMGNDAISAVFCTKHIINAFDAAGPRVEAFMDSTADLFNGKPFLMIEPKDSIGDLSDGVHVIVFPYEKKGW